MLEPMSLFVNLRLLHLTLKSCYLKPTVHQRTVASSGVRCINTLIVNCMLQFTITATSRKTYSHTWLRAIEADLGPLNFGLATAWKKATTRGEWRHYCGHSNAPAEYALNEDNNDGFRQLLHEPRWCSASQLFVANNVQSFDANIRKPVYSLWSLLNVSDKAVVRTALCSDLFVVSPVFRM